MNSMSNEVSSFPYPGLPTTYYLTVAHEHIRTHSVREGLKSVLQIPAVLIASGAPAAQARDEVVFAK